MRTRSASLLAAKGMTEIQRATELNRATLYAALHEDGNPTLATVMKVLSALHVELGAKVKDEA